MTVTNSTIIDNAGNDLDYFSGTLTLGNSIVGNFIAQPGAFTRRGVNLVRSGLVAPGVINADPILGPLTDNGRPTLTRLLLYSSPAIDAGDTQVTIDAGLTTDQRGFARVIGGAVDLGAFEKSTSAPIPRRTW